MTQRFNTPNATRCALAAGLSLALAGAASATGSATVDYYPTNEEAFPGAFVSPGPPPVILPGTFAEGPFTLGGTLNDDTADAQPGLTVWGGPAGPGFGSFTDPRRIVFEYDLAAVRAFSTDPGEVLDATFSFVFDDIVADTTFADRLLNSFTLEVYTDTADGALNGGADESGVYNGDYEGGAIASLLFEDAAGIKPAPVVTPGIAETFSGTIDGATVTFIEDYTDADLIARGFIGFEVDVTSVVADVIDDNSISHLGFRLISNEAPNGALQSLDASGFNPNLVVEVVPEPGSAAAILAGLLAARRRRK